MGDFCERQVRLANLHQTDIILNQAEGEIVETSGSDDRSDIKSRTATETSRGQR